METGCYWLFFFLAMSPNTEYCLHDHDGEDHIMVRQFFLEKRTLAQQPLAVLAWNPRCLGQPYSTAWGILISFMAKMAPFMPN